MLGFVILAFSAVVLLLVFWRAPDDEDDLAELQMEATHREIARAQGLRPPRHLRSV